MTKSVGLSVRLAKHVFSLPEAISNDQVMCVGSVITAGTWSHRAIRSFIFQLRDTRHFESIQQIPMWAGKGSAVFCNAQICLASTYYLCSALRIHCSNEHILMNVPSATATLDSLRLVNEQ